MAYKGRSSKVISIIVCSIVIAACIKALELYWYMPKISYDNIKYKILKYYFKIFHQNILVN